MDSNPLSYDALKTVLQYMEANKRFQITKHIPSLQPTDSVTPLIISTLSFRSYGVEINSTNYSLKIHQEKPDGPNPAKIEDANRRGAIFYDLDRFGLEDHFAEDMVTPGDLEIVGRPRKSNRDIEKGRKRQMALLERSLKFYEKPLPRREGNPQTREQRIEDYRIALIPYYCYRDNRPSPYDVYIQLRRTDLHGSIVMERFPYVKKLPEATKYLNTKLLGNRRYPIIVRKLIIDKENKKTIRLPEGLKLKVMELGVTYISEASFFRPILSHVDFMHLYRFRSTELCLETLNLARSLRIDGFSTNPDWLPTGNEWLEIFQQLQCQELFVMNHECTCNIDYTILMRYWMENGKAAGTKFAFRFGDFERVHVIKNSVMEQFGGLAVTMTSGSKLVINFDKAPRVEQDREDWEQWFMKMEVMDNFF